MPMNETKRLLAGLLLALAAGSSVAAESPAMRLERPQEASLVAVAAAGKRLVALGDHGVVVLSDDGLKWTQADSVPVDTLLTALSFADDRNGWAVGHGGVLLRTMDGGQSWKLQQRLEDSPVLLSVWFENAQHGIVVGSYGYASETHDGGDTWSRLVVSGEGDDFHLNQIFPGPQRSLFIAAEAGNAYRSLDNGKTWQTMDTGASGSLWSGTALRDGRVLLAGMSGRVLVSDDLGDNWREVDSGSNEAITDIRTLADGRVALVGNGGLVAFADSDLARFSTATRPDRQNLSALVPLRNGDLLVLGEAGVSPEPATGTPERLAE
ncbi:Ycf48-like protein [compost metagenome]